MLSWLPVSFFLFWIFGSLEILEGGRPRVAVIPCGSVRWCFVRLGELRVAFSEPRVIGKNGEHSIVVFSYDFQDVDVLLRDSRPQHNWGVSWGILMILWFRTQNIWFMNLSCCIFVKFVRFVHFELVNWRWSHACLCWFMLSWSLIFSGCIEGSMPSSEIPAALSICLRIPGRFLLCRGWEFDGRGSVFRIEISSAFLGQEVNGDQTLDISKHRSAQWGTQQGQQERLISAMIWNM